MISHAFSVHGPLKIHWPNMIALHILSLQRHQFSPWCTALHIATLYFSKLMNIERMWVSELYTYATRFTVFEAKLAQWLANRSLPSSIYFAILQWLVGGLV